MSADLQPLRIGDGLPDGSRPVAFLDRDGVIIENRADYVRGPTDVALIPGAAEAVLDLREHGFDVVIVTNQACVGKGMLTASEATHVHRHVLAELGQSGPGGVVSFLCPHIAEHRCPCRKPAAGMLWEALRGCGGHVPAGSVLVGDALTDMLAAEHMSLSGHLVLTGRGREQLPAVKASGLSVEVHADVSACVSALVRSAGQISRLGSSTS